jgi:APA family basic amino acid/polyamine antiporter
VGLPDAIVIGLGSMIGAGVFSAWAPAAGAAGSGLLLGLCAAGVVAFCNATSSAQLAAQFPTSGGTYVYGRELLGPWPGFLAGWAFVVGKLASSAAMAMTFAAYAVPAPWQKPVAVLAVIALAVVNSRGVTRTTAMARVLVAVSLVALCVVAAVGFSHPAVPGPAAAPPSLAGVLPSAGFLFFAFAGYARIATMGEEVKDPERTIPRAITGSLALALVLYLLVGLSAIGSLGPAALATSTSPLADVAGLSGAQWPVVLTRVGATAAALGALLAMVAGIGRTSLAMARTGDLPGWLAAVHPRYRVPHRAELAVGALVSVLVLVTDLRGAIGFSSFGVLLYYLIANLAALRQARERRRYPRLLAVGGVAGCVLIGATLPAESVLAGLVVVAAGLAYRSLRLRLAPGSRQGR